MEFTFWIIYSIFNSDIFIFVSFISERRRSLTTHIASLPVPRPTLVSLLHCWAIVFGWTHFHVSARITVNYCYSFRNERKTRKMKKKKKKQKSPAKCRKHFCSFVFVILFIFVSLFIFSIIQFQLQLLSMSLLPTTNVVVIHFFILCRRSFHRVVYCFCVILFCLE